MSTKIYQGRRLVEGANIWDTQLALRQVLDPIRDRLDAREMITRAITHLDQTRLGMTSSDAPLRSPIAAAYFGYEKDQAALDPRRTGHDPHRFEASFGMDPVTGRVLMLPYFDRDEYGEALDSMALLEEYGYWNNTERPEHLTEADWRERASAWERVMPGAPVTSMLSFTLRGTADPSLLGMLTVGGPKHEVVRRAFEDAVRDTHSPQRRAARIVREMAGQLLWKGVEQELTPHNWASLAIYLSAPAREISDRLAPAATAYLPQLTFATLYDETHPGQMPSVLEDLVQVAVTDHLTQAHR